MAHTPAASNVNRAQLLGLATIAQGALDIEDPADFWYRQGIRDAYAYAAAMLVTGRVADITQAAADRVTQLLGEGITDLGVLMEATEIAPRTPTGQSWVGQASFQRLTKAHPGIDRDLGSKWSGRRDIRISHRVTEGATVGLLYAYDRTWDEYAILDPAAHVQTVTRTVRAARETDPHLPVAEFVSLLRKHAPTIATQPDPSGAQL
jgi:hypothetical protein